MDVTKPCEFIGFGAIAITKPYKFIRFGAMDVTKPYEFIGFRAIATRARVVRGLPTNTGPKPAPEARPGDRRH